VHGRAAQGKAQQSTSAVSAARTTGSAAQSRQRSQLNRHTSSYHRRPGTFQT